jgi:hypothetical protein
MSSTREAGARRGPRIVLAVVLLCGIGGLFGALTGQLRTAIESDAAVVANERLGVQYLRPVTRLIIELSKAQSAAVRGSAVDSVALEAAVSGVSAADDVDGIALRTQQLWTQLRAEIAKVMTERPTAATAIDRYGDLIELVAELARRAGDTSQLILDPKVDSYYLMDAVLLQLPTAVTAAGRAADRAYLGRSARTTADSEAIDVDVAVDRRRVASATAALGTSVRKAMNETSRATMGPTLTEPLDVFRAAVEQLAPPAVLKQSGQPPNDTALSEAATRVRDSALPLAVAVLSELEGLLATRQEALATQRITALAYAGAGVIAGVVLLWWSVPPRGRGHGDDLAGATAGDDTGVPRDVAAVSVQLPAVDARDLLAIEELMHVGRGVRARPRDEASDAR